MWVRDHTSAVGGKPKLGLPFKGPVTIINKQGTPGKEVTYKVRDESGKTRTVHHNDLKEFIPRLTDPQPASVDLGSRINHADVQGGGRKEEDKAIQPTRYDREYQHGGSIPFMPLMVVRRPGGRMSGTGTPRGR